MTTNTEFKQSVTRCLHLLLEGDYVPKYQEASGLPKSCEFIAREFWLRRLPESSDTDMIRTQLLHLHYQGHFVLEETLPSITKFVTKADNIPLFSGETLLLSVNQDGILLHSGQHSGWIIHLDNLTGFALAKRTLSLFFSTTTLDDKGKETPGESEVQVGTIPTGLESAAEEWKSSLLSLLAKRKGVSQ